MNNKHNFCLEQESYIDSDARHCGASVFSYA